MLALRHAAERHPRRDHPGEILLRQHLLAVAPRIVGDKAADMLKQVAHPNARAVLRRIGPALHFGHIVFGEIVEAELAVVAQLEDRERGERLGHRGDAEQAVGGDGPLVGDVLDAEALHIGKLAVLDDAIDDAGHVLIGLKSGEKRVDFGGELVEGFGGRFLRRGGNRACKHESKSETRFPAHDNLPDHLRRGYQTGGSGQSAIRRTPH